MISLLLFLVSCFGLDQRDWLLHPTDYVSVVRHESQSNELHLENGLVRRTLRLGPSPTTVSLENLRTQEQWLRAVGPEARLTIDGQEYLLGGLQGQPIQNYLKPEWLADMTPLSDDYQLVEGAEGWRIEAIQPRLAWKKRPEWLAKEYPWPPPGKHVVLSLQSQKPGLPKVELHYEIYDGLPLIAKWLEVINASDRKVCIERFVNEELHLTEVESTVEGTPDFERYPIWVETDYAFAAMDPANAQQAVQWEVDTTYATQVNYERRTKCLLRCSPKIGPSKWLEPGERWSTFRTWELFLDGGDRERRGLAQRRMYRTLAPWTNENPLMFHKIHSDQASIEEAIQQAADVGFEMIIMSFGSGINLENRDAAYRKGFRDLANAAHRRGIALGGYTLTGSRSAATPEENTQGSAAKFGVMPCLGAAWGEQYLQSVQSFLDEAQFDVLENDGPYPGDLCNATEHAHHHGEADSQWIQWEAQANLYRWCRAHGVYVNQPDWYFLVGGSKTGMGYRETNWSLPRAEQQIIERQNIFDGTWTKTSSMGWMFVPLSQYHGGGEAATIEPLDQHRDHYAARFANLLGSGTQACYRGPRLYDTPATRELVREWVTFYKAHRGILSGDLIHLRRADGRDWDGWLMVDPELEERGFIMLFNPTASDITRTLQIPLYYTGLQERVGLRMANQTQIEVRPLNERRELTLDVTIPAQGHVRYFVTPAAGIAGAK